MRFILGELADNPMTGSDFDWMVSNHAVYGWKAPVKASVSGVSLLQLSPFFASIFPLFPQNRLILRLILTEREVRITVKVTALHVDTLGDSSCAFFPLTSGREIA